MSANSTHWFGCWKDPSHHECAVALVEKAEEVIVDMFVDSVPQAAIEEARKWMRWKNGLTWAATSRPHDEEGT